MMYFREPSAVKCFENDSAYESNSFVGLDHYQPAHVPAALILKVANYKALCRALSILLQARCCAAHRVHTVKP